MHPDQYHRTAFQTRFGLFEHMVIPLGLSNVPGIHKKYIYIYSVFQGALEHFCTVYFDDILVYSSSTSEHLQHIKWVLFTLRSNSLFAKPTKYVFDLTEFQ